MSEPTPEVDPDAVEVDAPESVVFDDGDQVNVTTENEGGDE